MDKLLAWHFCSEDRRLGYGDGREIKEGESLRVEGTPVLCKFGLHASVRILDALKYASGPDPLPSGIERRNCARL